MFRPIQGGYNGTYHNNTYHRMITMSFEKIIEFTLLWEGGDKATDDKSDPGKYTKYGISSKAHPDVDVKNLTLEQAKEIYKREYWDRIANGYDDLDMCAMDSAVNVGTGRVKKWLVTCKTWHELLAKRREHYRNIIVKNPALKKYEKGWENRCKALEEFLS